MPVLIIICNYYFWEVDVIEETFRDGFKFMDPELLGISPPAQNLYHEN